MSLARLLRSLQALRQDTSQMRARAADWASLLRYCQDRLFIAFHFFYFVSSKGTRIAVLKNGLRIAYRRDRGDLQSVREVVLQEVYRLPSNVQRKIILDLGANIGLAATWLGQRYKAESVFALEPDKVNCDLVRENFVANGIPGFVIEAAVGGRDGTAKFQPDSASNKGRISTSGKDVRLLSMPSLYREFGISGNINLLKIDIEGSEQDLLTGDISWLDRIDEIIIEFHPTIVPYKALVRTLVDFGFAYTAPRRGDLAMDYFKRIRS